MDEERKEARRYNITERDDWFILCRDFRKIFHRNWLHFQDAELTQAFGHAMIDIRALEGLLAAEEGEGSMQEAVLRQYGRRGLELIEKVI